MSNTTIILSIIVSAFGLGLAIISTIKAYYELKKATEEKISKRKKEISLFKDSLKSLELIK